MTAFNPGQSPPPVRTPIRIERETYRPCRTATLLALAAVVALSGCGGGSSRETRVPGRTLTIYTSLPRHGVSARVADAVAAGEQLALADAHDRADGRRVRLVELDNSDPAGPVWAPSVVEENARRAVADTTTIAYIGELGLGASAVSVPVTNDAGILQVSPQDGLTSLTRTDTGATTTGGPERYYPSDRRTFLRLVPPDVDQAATLVSLAAADGVHQLAVVQDDRLFARELASEVAALAPAVGLAVVGVVEAKDDPTSYPSLAATLAPRQPDAVLYTGTLGEGSAPLLAAVHQALPQARFYGSSALASASPAPDVPVSVEVVKPALPTSRYPPAGRRVLDRLRAELGAPIVSEALYGYEAMQIVLEAIRRAGRHGNDRPAVAHAALALRGRRGVLGPYTLNGHGDTSLTDFASYTLSNVRLVFTGMRGPGPALPH